MFGWIASNQQIHSQSLFQSPFHSNSHLLPFYTSLCIVVFFTIGNNMSLLANSYFIRIFPIFEFPDFIIFFVCTLKCWIEKKTLSNHMKQLTRFSTTFNFVVMSFKIVFNVPIFIQLLLLFESSSIYVICQSNPKNMYEMVPEFRRHLPTLRQSV